jgi:hypothetical protein
MQSTVAHPNTRRNPLGANSAILVLMTQPTPQDTPPAKPSPRTARLSVRVPDDLVEDVHDAVRVLNARGVRTSYSELVEMLVDDGLACDTEQLHGRLCAWRIATHERRTASRTREGTA